MDYIIRKILRELESRIDKKEIENWFFGKVTITKNQLQKGVCMIYPNNSITQTAATGLLDEENFGLTILIMKLPTNAMNKNASEEPGEVFMTRIMEGKDDDGVLRRDTIRYIVRNNYRVWSTVQPQVSIKYDVKAVDVPGAYSAQMDVDLQGIISQPIL